MALHHYVPQFHQRLFRPDRHHGRVWRYDKKTDRHSIQGISRSMALPDYYSIPAAEGVSDSTMETLLSQIEGQAARVIKHIIKLPDGPWQIHPNDQLAIAMYLGTLYLRGPAQRMSTDALATFSARLALDMAMARDDWVENGLKAGMGQTRDELEQARKEWEEGRITVEANPAQSILNLQVGLEGVTPILVKRRWLLLRRRVFPYLVLGDQPVTLIRPRDLSRFLGAGPATPGVEIYCPLNPQNLLAIEDAPYDGVLRIQTMPALIDQETQDDWVQKVNERSWASARQYVIARSQADLEFTRLGIPPEQRGAIPGLQVSGGLPDRWKKLLPDEIKYVPYPTADKPAVSDDT
jgi:hypothetical protein